MNANTKIAAARTGAPIGVGTFIIYLAALFGVDVPTELIPLLTGVAIWLWWVFGRALETYNPKLGFVLGIAKQPAYSTEPAPSPGAGEELVTEVVPEEDTAEGGSSAE